VPNLHFEAYDSGGDNPTLGAILDTVEETLWNGWVPDVSHRALNQSIWYGNEYENGGEFTNIEVFVH
jgi:hypothetical protein